MSRWASDKVLFPGGLRGMLSSRRVPCSRVRWLGRRWAQRIVRGTVYAVPPVGVRSRGVFLPGWTGLNVPVANPLPVGVNGRLRPATWGLGGARADSPSSPSRQIPNPVRRPQQVVSLLFVDQPPHPGGVRVVTGPGIPVRPVAQSRLHRVVVDVADQRPQVGLVLAQFGMITVLEHVASDAQPPVVVHGKAPLDVVQDLRQRYSPSAAQQVDVVGEEGVRENAQVEPLHRLPQQV